MGNQIKLVSGFTFDYTNLFGEGKVTATELPDAKAAHKAVCHMRETGEVRGHLSKDGTPELVLFPQLPYVKEGNLNSPADIEKLKKFGENVKGRIDIVVSLGIGGSFLGNKVLFDVGCGEFWNAMTPEERGGWPEVYFISKSGGTLDTMSNFMVIYDELSKTANVETEVVAVTDPNEEKPTLLKKLATEKGWPTFRVPDGVGGRFSVFSDVGLSLAACVGFDIEAFLKGARDMDEACKTDDMMKNPAMLNAALKFAAAKEHGREIEVMMPYGDYLKSLSEWYIQLLAESLGKEDDREGKKVYYGRTPLVAVGTTDMHAQTQQHQEGRLNKIVQFIRVADWPEDCLIPDVFPEAQKLSDIAGVTMAEALEVARVSNEEALASNGRYSACFTLPTLNAYHLGELMYMLALSVAYEGEFADVDAFNQPGVEAYKRIMGPRLAEVKKARAKKA